MISFNFSIRNPWCNTFKNLWCRAYNTPFKNKFIELEVTKDTTFVSFMFGWTIRQSHAGLDLELGLFGYCVRFNFCDQRHWNTDTNCYYKYDEF